MDLSTRIENGQDSGWALCLAEQYAKEQQLGMKDELRLRLIVEETAEILRNLSREYEGSLSIEDNPDTGYIVRLTLSDNARADEKEYDTKLLSKGIAGKISVLLSISYEAMESAEKDLADIGVRKASKDDFAEMGLDSSGSAYVWTGEAYNNLSFDRLNEDDAGNWIEISHSIIANLADDVRIFVFEDHSELAILVPYVKEESEKGQYAIDPELLELKKIPVAKTRFQIKMVQLLYGKLPDKQASTDSLKVEKIRIPCEFAPKGYVSLLRYTPVTADTEEPKGAVLLMHGGAFMLPALPYHYRLAEAAARRTGCSVFFMLQDLGPRYSLPLPIREAYEAYTYLIFHGKELGIDVEHIAAMGDSSGGTMTAALALLARDHSITPLAGQVMLYPSIGLNYETQSMKDYDDVPVVNAEAIRAYHKMIKTDSDADDYYLHPASAASLKGLPPAYIETAEFDALRDEGIAYAKMLKGNGCEVELNKTKGTVHAYDMAKDSKVLAEAMDRRMAFLNRVLSR